jgi:hypothetical protein
MVAVGSYHQEPIDDGHGAENDIVLFKKWGLKPPHDDVDYTPLIIVDWLRLLVSGKCRE